jgi:hypothetical protein
LGRTEAIGALKHDTTGRGGGTGGGGNLHVISDESGASGCRDSDLVANLEGSSIHGGHINVAEIPGSIVALKVQSLTLTGGGNGERFQADEAVTQ